MEDLIAVSRIVLFKDRRRGFLRAAVLYSVDRDGQNGPLYIRGIAERERLTEFYDVLFALKLPLVRQLTVFVCSFVLCKYRPEAPRPADVFVRVDGEFTAQYFAVVVIRGEAILRRLSVYDKPVTVDQTFVARLLQRKSVPRDVERHKIPSLRRGIEERGVKSLDLFFFRHSAFTYLYCGKADERHLPVFHVVVQKERTLVIEFIRRRFICRDRRQHGAVLRHC